MPPEEYQKPIMIPADLFGEISDSSAFRDFMEGVVKPPATVDEPADPDGPPLPAKPEDIRVIGSLKGVVKRREE